MTEERASSSTPIVDEIAPWMGALAGALRLGLAGLTRVRVEGAIDEIPRTGPVIVAANHCSNLDVPVLGSSLMPKLGRRLQWLGKKELFAWPVVGWVARKGGVHAVDRSTADVEAFRLAKRILDEGHALFVFPEGTRSRDGALGEGRDGVAVLALRTGAPIVPIGIAGSYERWPEAAPSGRPRHGPRRLPVPPRRRPATWLRSQGDQVRGDRDHHAPHRRAAPRAPARPIRGSCDAHRFSVGTSRSSN
jgi:1-acyl-sn-glycerol-3-phosphate acyltransferase